MGRKTREQIEAELAETRKMVDEQTAVAAHKVQQLYDDATQIDEGALENLSRNAATFKKTNTTTKGPGILSTIWNIITWPFRMLASIVAWPFKKIAEKFKSKDADVDVQTHNEAPVSRNSNVDVATSSLPRPAPSQESGVRRRRDNDGSTKKTLTGLAAKTGDMKHKTSDLAEASGGFLASCTAVREDADRQAAASSSTGILSFFGLGGNNKGADDEGHTPSSSSKKHR